MKIVFFEAGCVTEWTSGRMAGMVNIINVFFVGAGFGDVSWVMSQQPMSLISLLALTSKISSMDFVMVGGF